MAGEGYMFIARAGWSCACNMERTLLGYASTGLGEASEKGRRRRCRAAHGAAACLAWPLKGDGLGLWLHTGVQWGMMRLE